MTIPLTDFLRIPNADHYKVHFARWNGQFHPLESLGRDPQEWQAWQEWKPRRDEFNRPHIFAVAQVWYEQDAWLFGGIFDVVDRHPDHYNVRLSETARPYIGRLKLHNPYRERATRVNLENHLDRFEVIEVLRIAYDGRPFPGFDSIDIDFNELETIVRNGRIDWRSALENIKGVYLITDRSTGKRYVGSAYGESGIWSRWCDYVQTGHGGNVELQKLVTDPSLEYSRKNFQICLLEAISSKETDTKVLNRESFWKRVLFSELNRHERPDNDEI